MVVESKAAIRYYVEAMKKPIVLHESVFSEKSVYGFSFIFGRQNRAEMEICEKKSGSSQIHYGRKNMAFCNTCEQAEKTVYGLSFLLDDKIVQNGKMRKKRPQPDPRLQRN